MKTTNDMVKCFSTGTRVFDKALGDGLPWGRIINIVGDKSTGKSALACEIIAQTRKALGKKLRWKYDDAEAGVNFDTQMMYGFDVIDEDTTPSYTIEDFEVNLQKELQEIGPDEYLIYVLDSFDSLTSCAEIKRGEEMRKKVDAGKWEGKKDGYNLEKQYNLNEFFRLRRLDIRDRRCLLVIVSQVRENIGVIFGKRYRRTGGKALDFYSSQIIWLSETEKYYSPEGLCTGISIKAFCEKNKVGLPYRSCYLNLMFNAGIDPVVSNLLYLYDLKTDEGKTKATSHKIVRKNPETKAKEAVEEGILGWDGAKYNLNELTYYVEQNNLEEELGRRVDARWDEAEERASFVKGMGRKPRDFTPQSE